MSFVVVPLSAISEVYGPFSFEHEAITWAKTNLKGERWKVVELIDPGEDYAL